MCSSSKLKSTDLTMFFYNTSFIRNNHSDFMGFDIQLDFPNPSQMNKKKK